MNEKDLRLNIIKTADFSGIVGIISGYLVGLGLVSYLGKPINLLPAFVGVLIALSFFLSGQYLAQFFKILDQQKAEPEIYANRNIFLFLGLLFLTTATVFAVLLVRQDNENSIYWLFILLITITQLIYAIPPFELEKKGLGKIITAIIIVLLSPAFGFFLQLREFHPTLLLLTFPSIFLLIASYLALSLETYYQDLKKNKKTLMTVVDWRKGMNIHNLFIVVTYFIYGIAAIIGLPWRLMLSILLSIPFAAVQFWLMWQIGTGNKPKWRLLRWSAISSIGLLTYFLLFSLWTG